MKTPLQNTPLLWDYTPRAAVQPLVRSWVKKKNSRPTFVQETKNEREIRLPNSQRAILLQPNKAKAFYLRLSIILVINQYQLTSLDLHFYSFDRHFFLSLILFRSPWPRGASRLRSIRKQKLFGFVYSHSKFVPPN